MTDSRALAQTPSDLAAHRLRNLLTQFGLSRSEAAALLREIAAQLDGQPVDAHIRDAAEHEAERLRSEGLTVSSSLEVRTIGAARVLGRSAGTLRNWRSSGTGPAWRADHGIVHYSLIDLLTWQRELSRPVTITAAGDV